MCCPVVLSIYWNVSESGLACENALPRPALLSSTFIIALQSKAAGAVRALAQARQQQDARGAGTQLPDQDAGLSPGMGEM